MPVFFVAHKPITIHVNMLQVSNLIENSGCSDRNAIASKKTFMCTRFY